MDTRRDLLAPPPVVLPVDDSLNHGATAEQAALAHPDSPVAWAALAEAALATAADGTVGDKLTAYALARTGYHRGLDRLRHNGWKGFGPVPLSEPGNQGVLRAIAALARAAQLIGETSEYERCRELLRECDPSAPETLIP